MELLINEVIIPVLAIVLTAVATAVAAKIRQKYGLDIEDKVIEQAVHWAGSRLAKRRRCMEIRSPATKLDMAVQFVWRRSRRQRRATRSGSGPRSRPR